MWLPKLWFPKLLVPTAGKSLSSGLQADESATIQAAVPETIDYGVAMGIAENIRSIEIRIERAATKSGRRAEDVRLVVVTKNQPVAAVNEVLDAGVRDLGENRVQELLAKHDVIDARATWHLIGTLQRKKVAKVVGKVALIHSVDSVALAEEIGRRAREAGVEQEILVQVSISGEETKMGLSPAELERDLDKIRAVPGLSVKGFMTMAPLVGEAEEARPVFAGLARLRHRFAEHKGDLPHLSMGMTNDFEVAVEEGATIVRVGTAVFTA